MALDLTVTYAGQVDDSDPDYPQGKARNLVVEDDGTGTPYEEKIVNDTLGFHQALLLAAGITPSGDPDNANVSQYAEAVKWIAAAAHNTFDPVVMFDAVGEIVTELEDDTAELNACFAAAYAAIDGGNVTVDLGGRSYRVTGALTCFPHVNVKHGKIVMYHATANFLVWGGTAATQRTKTVWEDVDLSYAEANTGKTVVNAAGVVDVVFRNCHLNASGFCTGKLVESAAASVFTFEDCKTRSATTVSGFTSSLGTIAVKGGEHTMAPAAASDLISAVHTRVEGAKLIQVSTLGAVAFVATSSGNDCIVSDCICDVDDSGAGSGTSLVRLVDGAVVQTSGNIMINDATLYIQDGLVADGSRLQLLPELAFTDTGVTPAAPPEYESVTICVNNASPPDVALGDPLFKGQHRRIAVRNIFGSAWTGVIGFTSDSDIAYTEAGGLTDLADDEIATIEFMAATLDTGLAWVQVGDAAQHFVA